jgi:hypothetical protein
VTIAGETFTVIQAGAKQERWFRRRIGLMVIRVIGSVIREGRDDKGNPAQGHNPCHASAGVRGVDGGVCLVIAATTASRRLVQLDFSQVGVPANDYAEKNRGWRTHYWQALKRYLDKRPH